MGILALFSEGLFTIGERRGLIQFNMQRDRLIYEITAT